MPGACLEEALSVDPALSCWEERGPPGTTSCIPSQAPREGAAAEGRPGQGPWLILQPCPGLLGFPGGMINFKICA